MQKKIFSDKKTDQWLLGMRPGGKEWLEGVITNKHKETFWGSLNSVYELVSLTPPSPQLKIECQAAGNDPGRKHSNAGGNVKHEKGWEKYIHTHIHTYIVCV